MTRSRIRVVHFLPNLNPGGAQRIGVHILRALDQTRFEPSAIVFRGPNATQLETMLDEGGIPVTFLGKGPGFDPRMYPRVTAALRRHQPDVVHTHMQVLLYALPALKLRRTSAIVHTIHNLAERDVGRELRWVNRLAFRVGVIPVAIGPSVASSLKTLYRVTNVRVIPNAIPIGDYSRPSITRGAWRAREGFAPDDVLLGSAGRLTAQKNYALLLDAFASLQAECPRARLVVAGTGEQQATLEAKARQLNISSKIRFLGPRHDIPDFLGAIDLFVLPSDWEGNPLCILEAMAAGLPIVATTVGGVPEMVNSGKEGLLVRPGDWRELANALRRLLSDSALCESMGEAAGVRARTDFDLPHMIQAYAALYEAAMERFASRVAAEASLRA